jgi:hypothetical protein
MHEIPTSLKSPSTAPPEYELSGPSKEASPLLLKYISKTSRLSNFMGDGRGTAGDDPSSLGPRSVSPANIMATLRPHVCY